jgi:hypothetical protein
MGIVKGLGKIQDYNKAIEKKREERSQNSGKKTEWFKLAPGESVKVRFLQELDADSPNYSEKNDLAILAIMHQGPGSDGWKRKAQCTADEGDCYACEQYKAFVEGWPRSNSLLYINVLLNPETDDEQVVVLNQGMSPKQITPTLLEYAGETGSITDRVWKITRNGEGTDTSYTIVAFDKKDFEKSTDDYEVFPLETIPRKVAYEEQAAFFGDTAAVSKRDDASSASPEAKKESFVSW